MRCGERYCSADAVSLCLSKVFNGVVSNAPLLERLCGTVPAGLEIKSSGNTMTVVFRTDSSVSNGGFTADYSSDEAAGKCRGWGRLRVVTAIRIMTINCLVSDSEA